MNPGRVINVFCRWLITKELILIKTSLILMVLAAIVGIITNSIMGTNIMIGTYISITGMFCFVVGLLRL